MSEEFSATRLALNPISRINERQASKLINGLRAQLLHPVHPLCRGSSWSVVFILYICYPVPVHYKNSTFFFTNSTEKKKKKPTVNGERTYSWPRKFQGFHPLGSMTFAK